MMGFYDLDSFVFILLAFLVYRIRFRWDVPVGLGDSLLTSDGSRGYMEERTPSPQRWAMLERKREAAMPTLFAFLDL